MLTFTRIVHIVIAIGASAISYDSHSKRSYNGWEFQVISFVSVGFFHPKVVDPLLPPWTTASPSVYPKA
jgi:hypothetical protein